MQRTIYDRNGQVVRLIRPNEYDLETDGSTNLDGTPKAVTHDPIRQEYVYDLDKNLTDTRIRSGKEPPMDDKAWYSYNTFNHTIKMETFDGNIQLNRYEYDIWGTLQSRRRPSPTALPTTVSRLIPSPSSITCGLGSTTRSLAALPTRRIPTGGMG